MRILFDTRVGKKARMNQSKNIKFVTTKNQSFSTGSETIINISFKLWIQYRVRACLISRSPLGLRRPVLHSLLQSVCNLL